MALPPPPFPLVPLLHLLLISCCLVTDIVSPLLRLLQGPVVRRLDNCIQRINPYPVDKIWSFSNKNLERANYIRWIGIYFLDKVIHSSYNRVLKEPEGVGRQYQWLVAADVSLVLTPPPSPTSVTCCVHRIILSLRSVPCCVRRIILPLPLRIVTEPLSLALRLPLTLPTCVRGLRNWKVSDCQPRGLDRV